ncbi:MAG: hypothetical protein F6K31_03185 [Symploca sp. SIO2G7]|nr:hypothetical protein [Symploca sp. SIO2G7]
MNRFKAIYKGQWTSFGLKIHEIEQVANPFVLKFENFSHRERLWNLWRIQLVRYIRCRKKVDSGWVLIKPYWEDKIDFLEKIVLFEIDDSQLPMPWLRDDFPKPWDAVLGGTVATEPNAWDLVLSPNSP